MIDPVEPSVSHQPLQEKIFEHPITHDLGWHVVNALFQQPGHVDEKADGDFKVTRNGQILLLHPPLNNDVSETNEALYLRYFVEQAEPGVRDPVQQ